MPKVVQFRFFGKDDSEKDINQLLKNASLVLKEASSMTDYFQDKIYPIKNKQAGRIFEGKISKEIFAKNLVSSGVLLCGIYAAKLMEELMTDAPESWWAIDYAFSEKAEILKKGGDACFIICGIFPKRANRRLMDREYYQKFGISLYHRFYGATNKEIGYHMANNFSIMSEVVNSVMKNF